MELRGNYEFTEVIQTTKNMKIALIFFILGVFFQLHCVISGPLESFKNPLNTTEKSVAYAPKLVCFKVF